MVSTETTWAICTEKQETEISVFQDVLKNMIAKTYCWAAGTV
jgi:hypothetical protein